MADLVDRLEQPARDVPGLRDLLMGPSVLDGPVITRLREEIRELRLHLNLVHDCDWRHDD